MPRKLLFLFPVLLLFWGLSYATFWNPDEGRYSAAAFEMAFGLGGNSATGAPTDWLVPHLNTLTRLNKPPLIYWLTAGNFSILGPSEWSARLVPTTASLLILVLLANWTTRVWGQRAGFGAALVWATTVFSAAMGRTANTDMLLSAGMFLIAFGIFWALESEKRLFYGALAGVGMAVAMLSKGPVGIALPLLVVFVYLFASRSWKQVPWSAAALALVIGLGLSLPWFLAVEERQSGFMRQFFITENLGRFSGGEEFHKPTPFYFYVPILLGGLLPWTPFLIAALKRENEWSPLQRKTWLFALLWGALIVAFFSKSQTKLISYILPAFPAWCLLIGVAVSRWEWTPRALRRVCIGLALFCNLLLVVAVTGYPKQDKATQSWKIAPGILLDERIFAREIGLPWVWGITALMATSSGFLLLANRRPDGKTLLLAQGASASATVVTLLALAGQIAKYEDGSIVLTTLAPRLQPGDKIVGYRSFLPTAIFYTGRPVTFFHFKNTSGLIPAELEKSPYFFQLDRENDLLGWQKQNPGRTFVVTRGFLDEELRPHYFEWGRNNDFFLYSNTPKPDDFTLDFVAPRKRDAPEIHGVPSQVK